jgi:hypothetical protein
MFTFTLSTLSTLSLAFIGMALFCAGIAAGWVCGVGVHAARHRAFVVWTYARAAVAVLVPAYGRRWARQREAASRRFRESLVLVDEDELDGYAE